MILTRTANFKTSKDQPGPSWSYNLVFSKDTTVLLLLHVTCMVSRLWRMVSESDRLELRSRTACCASFSPAVMSLTSFQNLTAKSKRLRSHFSLSWACLWASSQWPVRLHTRSWMAERWRCYSYYYLYDHQPCAYATHVSQKLCRCYVTGYISIWYCQYKIHEILEVPVPMELSPTACVLVRSSWACVLTLLRSRSNLESSISVCLLSCSCSWILGVKPCRANEACRWLHRRSSLSLIRVILSFSWWGYTECKQWAKVHDA